MEVPAPLPSHFLVKPCHPVGVGNTVGSLAKAYVENTGCVGKYEIVIDSIEEYNETIKEMNSDTELHSTSK